MSLIEQKPSLEEVLEHHGVMGMKWGHRKATDGGSSGGSAPKKTKPTKQDIMDARARQASRLSDYNRKVDAYNLAKPGSKSEAKALKDVQKADDILSKGADAKTAAKMTSGEKWVAGISWGVVAVTSAGLIAGRVAASR